MRDEGNVRRGYEGNVRRGYEGNVRRGYEGNVRRGYEGNVRRGYEGNVRRGYEGSNPSCRPSSMVNPCHAHYKYYITHFLWVRSSFNTVVNRIIIFDWFVVQPVVLGGRYFLDSDSINTVILGEITVVLEDLVFLFSIRNILVDIAADY